MKIFDELRIVPKARVIAMCALLSRLRIILFCHLDLGIPFCDREERLISDQFVDSVMDSTVDALSNAYQEFVVAAAGVVEAKEISGGLKTASTDAALENFKQRWELFRVACDQAEEFVESVKQRIGSECLVDEATGSVTGKSGQTATTTGLPPISAVRLEQMSKAVRWLVIELQHGSGATGAASHTPSSVPFDARFSEDAGQ
ncbi:hypothetical protein BVC80_9039g43 [Macleaya cordata]|uniref:Mediator of RNA polymerase II transcription subunit 32 n=1 Tax=Macleaya cordata TaxID=56857 RepID=A0A200QYF7_MACCD|nr:hypothetical protein BVC80_9039g43 [Macleaya cordata]